MDTGDNTSNSTTGEIGDSDLFPTGFLYWEPSFEPERDVLVFAFTPRHYDNVAQLTYSSEDALELLDGARLVSAEDNGLDAGIRLPPKDHSMGLLAGARIAIVPEVG